MNTSSFKSNVNIKRNYHIYTHHHRLCSSPDCTTTTDFMANSVVNLFQHFFSGGYFGRRFSAVNLVCLSLLLTLALDHTQASRVSDSPLPKPVFVESPKDSYLIKNKPVTLRCRAQHAVKLKFKCSGGSPGETRQQLSIDPTTQVQQLESTVQIDRNIVEEYFGEDSYSCFCNAWNDEGVKATSESAQILTAYLRKHFFEPPYSDPVALGSQVEIRCLPPDGVPSPKTYWLKNEQFIDFEIQKNYRISSEGSLLILSAGWNDVANYSCVAENIASRRVSSAANLKIYVDGSWSTWSPWSPCSTHCGKGVQKRIRTCTNPPPSNGGGSCKGRLAFQQTECTATDCQLINGGWTPWSDWSTCGANCQQHRSRFCSSPAPQFGGRFCEGEDSNSRNCSGGMCIGSHILKDVYSTREDSESAMGKDISLIIVLSIFIPVVVILVFILLRRFNRQRCHHSTLYEAANTGCQLPYFADVNCKRNIPTNIPNGDVIIDNQYMHMNYDGRRSCASYDYTIPSKMNELSGKRVPPSEHLYDVPLISKSSDSNSYSEEHYLMTNGGGNELPTNSPHSSLNKTFHQSKYISEIEPALVNIQSEALVCKEIGSKGGRLHLPEYGVTLTIPEGSIVSDKSQKIFLAVLPKYNISPIKISQTLLSPVIWCGPLTVNLVKPAVISFEHCGSLKYSKWKLQLMTAQLKPTDLRAIWENVVTVGEERVDTPVYTLLEEDKYQAHIMVDQLRSYVLIGENRTNDPVTKRLKLVTSVPTPSSEGKFSLNMSVVDGTSAHLKFMKNRVRNNEACLADKPKSTTFVDNGSNMIVTLENIAPGWTISSGNQIQEINFSRIWNNCNTQSEEPPSLTFHMERISDNSTPNLPPLSCRLAVQQENMKTKQVIRINTDFPYAPVTDNSYQDRNKTSSATSSSGTSCSRMSAESISNEFSYHLPLRIRQQLCRCLDPPTSQENDWRELASQLNVDRYLNYFACKSSPTEHILDLWEARQEDRSSTDVLLRKLKELGRQDVTRIIESYSASI